MLTSFTERAVSSFRSSALESLRMH